jgi:phosphate acetyltransferase
MELEEARKMLCNPNYFASMMLAYGQADALVGGVSVESGSLLRPLFSLVRPLPGVGVISSCMMMQLEDKSVGDNGLMVMADCGVIPEPTVEQLANIAVEAGLVFRQMTGRRPFVAMLSYSTRGSAKTRHTEKVVAAASLARKLIADNHLMMELDGEMQVDAAISPRVAFSKAQGSPVAGRANVLIFPDLNSGNIATKMVQLLSRCRAYGQILMGINKPAADVSRGAGWDEILGVAAIVAIRAITYRELYPEQGARGLPAVDLRDVRFGL